MIDYEKILKIQIRTGSVKNVLGFGDSKTDPPIPCVIFQDNSIPNDKMGFLLWVYFPIGQREQINSYIHDELPVLVRAAEDNTGYPLFNRIDDYVAPAIAQIGGKDCLRAGITFFRPLVIMRQSV